MDYGGVDRRKTKNDKKRKRLNRGYKRGGQFRTHNVEEATLEESEKKGGVKKKGKKRKKK
jgi:hypothetical protein